MVSNVHAVVVVDGGQLGQLLEVLPSAEARAEKDREHLLRKYLCLRLRDSYSSGSIPRL